jgi:hypothetical protein
MAAIQPKPNRHDRQLWQPRRASRLNQASTSRPYLQVSELARKVRLQPPQVGHKVTCERAQYAQRARTHYAYDISWSRARGAGGCEGMNGGVARIIRA